MSDVLLFNTLDGGEVNSVNGVLELTDTLETAFYLSMFGGNDDDPGEGNKSLSWWGNSVFANPNKQYRSRTQYLLRAIPINSANLIRIQRAVEYDLAWSLATKVVKSLKVSVGMPKRNYISIAIETEVQSYQYVIPLEAAA